MTHPSPTAAEVKRFLEHVRDVAAEKDRELTKERAEQALTHIAALEAENELVRRCYSGLKAFALDVSRDPLNHWSGAAQRLLDTGVYDRAEKAEAQLATRLPDRELHSKVERIIETVEPAIAGGGYSSKSVGEAADAILALLSGAATAEQSFDGTIHPDGTPNQVTASTWLSGAATEEQPRLHRITCKYWNGWGPCDCGAGAATPAPIGGLTAQVLRLLDELDDDDLLPISRRHIIRTIQDLIKSTPTLQENTARHADGLDTHGGTGVGSASLSPVAPAPTAALTEEERNLLVFMADTNTALSFKERQRCREITYRLAAKSPPQGAEE